MGNTLQLFSRESLQKINFSWPVRADHPRPPDASPSKGLMKPPVNSFPFLRNSKKSSLSGLGEYTGILPNPSFLSIEKRVCEFYLLGITPCFYFNGKTGSHEEGVLRNMRNLCLTSLNEIAKVFLCLHSSFGEHG